jgi:hypothetical protein
MLRLLQGLLLMTWCAASEATDVKLTDSTLVRFAAPAEAREILVADDAFTRSLSRFDLQSRLKTDQDVDLAGWRELVAGQVRPWEADEMEMVSQSIARLSSRLDDYRLPLPPVIRLVRTTGDEEAGAAYSRTAAIVLPTKVMKYASTQLDRLLLHELFHLLSRQDGAIRSRLYGIVGFELCEPIELPASLAPRRITNPDAPLIDCTITLHTRDGNEVTAAPVLYASTKSYDTQRKPTLFESLIFRLLVVERRGGRWQPMLKSGEPIVIDPRKEPEFLDKIGKNTNYIIHPDEILADNFVRLVMQDADIPTPRIIEEMRRVLAK